METTASRLPLSKSVAARLLILHAMTPGARALDPTRLPACSDTQVMAAALAVADGNIDVADCGTAARFLTAYVAATPGRRALISGSPRMTARPMKPLVDALCSLGADIAYEGEEGHLPLRITGRKLSGGTVRLDASASSQFASALALVAPAMERPLSIELGGEIASMPYLKMTLDMLAARGVESERRGYTIDVANTPLRDVDHEAEPDWSAAAPWYELAAVTAGWVTLPGLRADSLQGDRALASLGERIGVVTEFTDEGADLSASPEVFSRLDLDMSDNPDLVPALAVTACLINIPFHFTGVANLRLKESDRLASLASQLAMCGWLLDVGPDFIGWEGATRPVFEVPILSSCDDHRIAMALAPIAAFVPAIEIDGAEAVNKSYPGFWDDLADAGFGVEVLDAEEDPEP